MFGLGRKNNVIKKECISNINKNWNKPNPNADFFRGSSYMRIQFLPDGSLFVLITNKVVIN